MILVSNFCFGNRGVIYLLQLFDLFYVSIIDLLLKKIIYSFLFLSILILSKLTMIFLEFSGD